MSKGVTPRSQDYARWYTDVVRKAELADYGPVKGTMVIRPYGYAIWDAIKEAYDRRFKATGHVNAYFPLLIPKSYFSREAEHVEGFAKECAVVTHSRLRTAPDGGVEVDPESKLEEELVIRPTSETVIWAMYKQWINSYRDLPILINQWANIVRWELRTRLFLRTTEFLWQEGHTAHATEAEAREEALLILDIYKEVAQNFAKAFDVTFRNEANEQEYVYATSWGVSTRLVGAVVMAHGDDKGLRLPPRIAPVQVVIVPIYKDESKDKVMEAAGKLTASMEQAGVRVKLDDRETVTPGFKFNDWEMKGVPLRLEIGPRDVEAGQAVVVRRDLDEKQTILLDNLPAAIPNLLEEIQASLFQQAEAFKSTHTKQLDDWTAFKTLMEQGGFAVCGWDGDPATETAIKEETKATIRCILQDEDPAESTCIYSGKPARHTVVLARAY